MDNENQVNQSNTSSLQTTENPDKVLNSTSGNLSKVVSSLDERKALREQLRSERANKKKIRPLPSINVMKKRLLAYLVNEKKKKLNMLSRLMSEPHNLCETYNQAREQDAKLESFPNKNPDEIKNLYFKYFGHKHGVKSEKEG